MKRLFAVICLLAYAPFAFGVIWIQPSRFGATVTPAWVYNITAGATNTDETTETSYTYGSAVTANQTGSCTKVSVFMRYQNFSGQTLRAGIYTSSGTLLQSGSVVSSGSFAGDVEMEVTLGTPQAVTNGTTYWVLFSFSASTFGNIAAKTSGGGLVDFSNGYSTFPLSSYSPSGVGNQYRVGLYIQ